MENAGHVFYDDFHALYDVINPGRDEEHSFYRDVISESDDVLEIACGSGTLTSTFSEHAQFVMGIDLSEKMLEIARKRVPTARFEKADMRDFRIDRKFDKVICPFNSFMHMQTDSDAVTALSLFRQHCRDSGYVVIDMFDIGPGFFAPLTIGAALADCRDPVSGRHIKVYEDSRFDPTASILEMTVRIVDGGFNTEVGRSSYAMRLYDPDHMTTLIVRAGLQPVRIETSYRRDKRQPGFRQIHFARPAAN